MFVAMVEALGGADVTARSKAAIAEVRRELEALTSPHEEPWFRVPFVRIDGVAKGDGKKVSMTIQRESWKVRFVEALRASGADVKQAPPPPGYLERELGQYVPDLSMGWAGSGQQWRPQMRRLSG